MGQKYKFLIQFLINSILKLKTHEHFLINISSQTIKYLQLKQNSTKQTLILNSIILFQM